MTRTRYARIAGFTFIFYIAAGITQMMLHGRATAGEGTAAKLANIAAHTSAFGGAIILDLLCCFFALILAVSLYAITRDEEHDLAIFGMACRIGEGVIGAANLPKMLALFWLATAGEKIPDASTVHAIGSYLLMPVGSSTVSALFFAVGSTIFSYLFLRGRMIPQPLAWLGLLASVVLVVFLPMQLARFVSGNWFVWMPMLVFELVLAVWLIVKGVVGKQDVAISN
ncbi:DUF4386 domain-containing protein [bacterium]|nr:DUF4386 domain-containing protein [bacterium]